MVIRDRKKFWLDQIAGRVPNRVLLRRKESFFSYSQTQKLAENLSTRLHGFGIERNTPVGIVMRNSEEFVVSVLALWKIGAVPVPLNTMNSAAEFTSQIQFAEIKLALCQREFLPKLRPIVKSETVELTKLTEAGEPIVGQFNPGERALRMFTSGSSGKPKLVELKFDNLMVSAESLDKFVDGFDSPVWLASLPFYHIGGFMIFVRSLLSGGEIVFLENYRAELICEAVSNYSINYFSVVSKTLKNFLEKYSGGRNSLKAVFAGGGPISADLMDKAAKLGVHVIKVYGSTETCSMVTALEGNEIHEKMSSAGKPMPDVKISIAENDEIVIESGSIAENYFRNEVESAERFRSGKYFSGDAGRIDEDGFLHIFGRLDDAIISGGEKVQPAEVAEILLSTADISDCAVLGTPDEVWGESVTAVIVVNKEIRKLAINEILSQRLAKYKIPKQYFTAEDIPRTQLGKIDYRAIREMISSGGFRELL